MVRAVAYSDPTQIRCAPPRTPLARMARRTPSGAAGVAARALHDTRYVPVRAPGTRPAPARCVPGARIPTLTPRWMGLCALRGVSVAP